MKKIGLFAILVLFSVTVGYAKSKNSNRAHIKSYYRTSLVSVDVNNIRGAITNSKKGRGEAISSYEDSIINILFKFHPTHIYFTLENKGDKMIKIIWDECAYMVESQGINTRIIHNRITPDNRENPQIPTEVVANSEINDLIFSKDGVYFNDQLKRWMFSRILSGEDKLKEIKFLMPIEISGKKYEYLFTFSVQWEKSRVLIQSFNDGREFYVRVSSKRK